MSGSTDAAIDVASRFLENLESVIRGKHEEIKLVLAALACRGHVLFERAASRARNTPGSSARRICSRPT
jgi:hypothetical protein